MNLERIVADLVERVEHRYYGKYRGTVVDNQDPAKLGRLKLKVPSVLGGDVVTGWATPCAPYGGATGQGFLFIPEVGAGVWTEFEEGDLEFPIWVGTFWSQPDAETEMPKPNQGSDGAEESSVQDSPTRKIIKTLKGHTIQFEDKDGEEMVMIREAKNGHLITLDKNGIKITDGANGNSISMDKNGAIIEDKNQNRIEMTASAINIYPASQCNLGSAAINMVNNLPACLFTGAPHAMDAKGHAKVLK
ncbi:MAG: phage baseplate assembly protein V [Accumulibacter sp.]|uniref:phage baseplate assembly protein V n=1 Tax=Accumulibacter sp. TaxID=2053492 RepID=UPI003314D2EC